MKKSGFIRYLAYITLIILLFSILPGEAFAAGILSEKGNGNQYAYENINLENNKRNSSENTNKTENSSSENLLDGTESRVVDRKKASEYRLEKKKIQEDLQLQKEEYRQSKDDFLKVRNQIRTGKINSNSEEAVNATRVYLNSSIGYMVSHLKNVRTNMLYSNGNGTEQRISAINENIRLLENEQAAVSNASSQQELLVIVRSVSGIWTNAQKASLTGAGQTVSQRIGEFLDKSGNLSENLETEIEVMNETGVDTSSLETRLASYNLYLKAAQEKKEAADAIYEDDSSTRENLEVANNYLRESLNNINKANQILRLIFDEMRAYNLENANETGAENRTETKLNETKPNETKPNETKLNNTISINNTNNNSSV